MNDYDKDNDIAYDWDDDNLWWRCMVIIMVYNDDNLWWTSMMMMTISDDMTGIRAQCWAAMPGMQTHIMPTLQYYIVWGWGWWWRSIWGMQTHVMPRIVWGWSWWWFGDDLLVVVEVVVVVQAHVAVSFMCIIPEIKRKILPLRAILKLMFLKIYMTAPPARSCKATAVHHLQMKQMRPAAIFQPIPILVLACSTASTALTLFCPNFLQFFHQRSWKSRQKALWRLNFPLLYANGPPLLSLAATSIF